MAVARRALLSARADAEAQETTHVATKAEEAACSSVGLVGWAGLSCLKQPVQGRP